METPRVRVARNFVRRFGATGLRRLLDRLADGASGQEIADEFNVSRERVRQWKTTFGTVLTIYQVHHDVSHVLDESGDRPPDPAADDVDDDVFDLSPTRNA